jgi:PAS domain S-box-containing protein
MGLAANAPNPIIAINPDLTIRYVNKSFETMTGFTPEEVIGAKPPYPWWPEEHREELGSGLKETVARSGRKRERVFQKKSGELFCVEVQTASVTNNGTISYLAVGWTDITERKRAEESLRGSEEKFRNLFVHAKDAVILADTQTEILVDVNPAGCRLLGLPKDKIVGMHQSEMYPPEMIEKYQKVFREYVAKGIVVNDDIIIQRANGARAQVEVSASVIKLAGKEMIQWVFRNVTERKQMEKTMRESEEKFSAAFRASPCAITITTLKDGVFLEVNDSFLRDNGYTREEVIGHSSKELKIWAKPEERDRILHELREQGRAVNEEYSSRTKSGRIRTMLLSAEPITIAGEQCIIAVTTDITDRNRMEIGSWSGGNEPAQSSRESAAGPVDFSRLLKR